MIVVDAVMWYWSPNGMRNFTGPEQGLSRVGYIEKSSVERLLEEAWLRGKRTGLEEAKELVRNTV